MINKKTSFIQMVTAGLLKLEDCILIGLLLSMICMAVVQIVMRNIFDAGILWGDEFIRVLVLWIGLIGAMIASRNNHHISIDVISRYLPKGIKKLTTLITAIFTCLICAVMAYFGFMFVMMEKQDNLMAFAAVPVWVCESIIPISFAIISFRYLLLSFTHLVTVFKAET